MPELWTPAETTREEWGSLQLVIGGGDFTFFRGIPARIGDWSSGDPFDDASASFTLPGVTFFDSIGAGRLERVRPWANVDIFYVPPDHPDTPKEPIWEGYIATFNHTDEGLQVQCLGALYQLDNYVKKPRFYEKVRKHEQLFIFAFPPHNVGQPHLRLGSLTIEYPSGWNVKDDKGNLATGHTTRNFGAWEKLLTGYYQDLLATMLTHEDDQWTLMKNPRRRPVLRVKDRHTVDWTVSVGQRGVTTSLTHDLTQGVNTIFGEGTDEIGGGQWRNSYVRGSATYYDPIAYDKRVFPWTNNPSFDPDIMEVQAFYNFGPGVSQLEAERDAARMIMRDRDPGWNGHIGLMIDPEEGSRWRIKAGNNIRLRYFNGTGYEGIVAHIAEVTANPEEGNVQLNVDTKARDLLTLAEVQERNRDSRTPARLLEVNRQSYHVEDRYAPWTIRSGFIPEPSFEMGHRNGGPREDQRFPYTYWTTRNPPSAKPEYYVRVTPGKKTQAQKNAGIDDKTTVVKIRVSERINIRISEMCAYNIDGTVRKVPFHWSVYYTRVARGDLPRDDIRGTPNPFYEYAFDQTHPDQDLLEYLRPHPDMIIGWGNGDQKAGFWPGRESDGDPVTGMHRDEGTWQHIMPRGYYHIYVLIYCETSAWFMGRLIRGVESDF